MISSLHPDLKRVVEKQLSVLDGRVKQCLDQTLECQATLTNWQQRLSEAEAERDVLTGILQGRVSPLQHEPR